MGAKSFLLVVAVVVILFGLAAWPRFGVIYAAESKTVLRIILPDENWELYEQPLIDGEAILIVPHLPFGDARDCGKRIDVYACRRLVEAAQ